MRVIAVIPAYRASTTISQVVRGALEVCDHIVVVDDNCPDKSGELVKDIDSNVTTLFRDKNGGVGAATKTGIRHAMSLDAGLIVKLDADGQMDPSLIPQLISPILDGAADFTKGTRFDSPEDLEGMPKVRLLGNSALSLINKFSSGYWTVNDPTNGFISLSRGLAEALLWEKIADDYFFESDLLFRARLIGARIRQMRMKAVYGSERSSLRPHRVLFPFIWNHVRNQVKRIAYMYLVREWNLGTIYLLAGGISLVTAAVASWSAIAQSQIGPVGTGTAVLASMGYILWVQFTTAFLTVDVTSEPR